MSIKIIAIDEASDFISSTRRLNSNLKLIKDKEQITLNEEECYIALKEIINWLDIKRQIR